MSLIPEGVKIYFGKTLDKKIAIENRIGDIFKKNSYNLIELPIYEYYSDLEESFSDTMKKNMFKFVDRDSGKILALRPDMTSLLAKLMKLRKDEIVFPERIYYTGDVFRYHKIKSGVYREICQAGVELIGAKGFRADIEVVTMAIDVMKALGLNAPKLEIGDVRILETIFNKLGINGEERDELKALISKKDIPELEKLVKAKGYDKIVTKLPLAIGGKEILTEMEEYGTEELKELVEALDRLGYKDNYVIDLGIVKEMGYYTGLVFNGMCSGSGDFIINGGRYDKLMGFPALGFVVNIDAVAEIVGDFGNEEKNGYYITGKNYGKMFEEKLKYTAEGERVEISILDMETAEERAYAERKGFRYIVDTEKMSIEEL